MPEPREWMRNWLNARQKQFESNYNEHKDAVNKSYTEFNAEAQKKNARLDAEGFTSRKQSLYKQDDFVPEYQPQYLTDMLGNLGTVKEYMPNSYSDPGGEVIRRSYYSRVIPQRKAEGTLLTPEQEASLQQLKRNLVTKYRAGDISRDDMRNTYTTTFNQTVEGNIDTPFYQAKEQTGWEGQYFPNNHTIVYTKPTESNRIHELAHSLSLYPTQTNSEQETSSRWTKPQNTAIRNRLELRKDAPSIPSESRSSTYWDNPEEVYSRLMQIRHDAGLTPDKVVEQKDLDKIRKKVKSNSALKELFMDRYTDNSLLKMLNEVASLGQNNTNNSFYARKGAKLRKKWKGF